jgi:hypothetical protein
VPVQRPSHPLRAHRPAAQREHAAVGVLQELPDLGLLQGAELLFAAAPEEGRDRHADLALQELVCLDRVDARRPRRVRGGRLAGPHEADEDERWSYRRHPMRSL